ncbi:MAG: CoA pyrophosphatase [Pseudomonadota bacterium]
MFDDPTLPDKIETLLAQCADAPSSDFDLNDAHPKMGQLRPAAVLVPLQFQMGAWQVILTKRPNTMKHHPGQVAFPGGKQDPNDATLEHTALREAREEIGAARANIIGKLPSHVTVTGFEVCPFVGVLARDQKLTPEAYEVEELFSVPLSFLLDPDNFTIQSRIWAGAPRYYYTIPHGPYYIWGATARMLYSLAQIWNAGHAD